MDDEHYKTICRLIDSLQSLSKVRPLTDAEREAFQDAIVARNELQPDEEGKEEES